MGNCIKVSKVQGSQSEYQRNMQKQIQMEQPSSIENREGSYKNEESQQIKIYHFIDNSNDCNKKHEHSEQMIQPHSGHLKEQQYIDKNKIIKSENDHKTDNNKTQNEQQYQKKQKRKINYHKGTIIDEGAFGKVYEGIDDTGENFYAIKTVQFTGSYEKIVKDIENLKNEVQLLEKLEHHPYIVKYHGYQVAKDKKSVDIIMEKIDGSSLKQILKTVNGSIEPSIVRLYTKQILEGVKYLHENGIIHRDLKGANIMVNNTEGIKLIDFGTSKQFKINELTKDDVHLCKSFKGSPYWMAPEIINRTGHNYKADIWSIGCVVLEMFLGRPPYSEKVASKEDLKNVMYQQIAKGIKPAYPNDIKDICRQFLDACLQFDPSKRPSVEELLKFDWIVQNDEIDYKNKSIIKYSNTINNLLESGHNGSHYSRNSIIKSVSNKQQKISQHFKSINIKKSTTVNVQQSNFKSQHLQNILENNEPDDSNIRFVQDDQFVNSHQVVSTRNLEEMVMDRQDEKTSINQIKDQINSNFNFNFNSGIQIKKTQEFKQIQSQEICEESSSEQEIQLKNEQQNENFLLQKMEEQNNYTSFKSLSQYNINNASQIKKEFAGEDLEISSKIHQNNLNQYQKQKERIDHLKKLQQIQWEKELQIEKQRQLQQKKNDQNILNQNEQIKIQ